MWQEIQHNKDFEGTFKKDSFRYRVSNHKPGKSKGCFQTVLVINFEIFGCYLNY